MPRVIFSQVKKSHEAEVGEWLYEVVERAGGGIPFSCKAGACGTCATEVLEGREHMGEQSAREIRTLTAADLDPGVYRLPCLGDVHGDIVFGRPRAASDTGTALTVHEVTVECSRPLTATVAEVRFFVTSEEFSFRPGQYMIFHIPDAERRLRRSYSISTPPSDRRHFEVCVRAIAGGAGSNFIHRLRTGRRLRVEGPYGEFALQEGSGKDILMIATGTGISPIKSMLMHLLDTKSSRRIRLFFGVRHEQELFYTDFCRGLASRYPSSVTGSPSRRPRKRGTVRVAGSPTSWTRSFTRPRPPPPRCTSVVAAR